MRDGGWLFTIVPWFIGIVFFLIIGYWITMAVIATKFINSGCAPQLVQTTTGDSMFDRHTTTTSIQMVCPK